jgi:hypothetical protein
MGTFTPHSSFFSSLPYLVSTTNQPHTLPHLMPLLDMPNETLCHIISYLASYDTEHLAHTFNSVITPLCLLVLQDRIARSRHERRMSSIFGDRLGCHEERASEKVYAKHKLHEKYGAFQSRNAELIPGNHFKTWDYLHLDGSLDWLQPVDDATAIKMADTLVTRPAANEDTMRIFEEAASRLGLTIPVGFTQFMTSLKMQKHIPSKGCMFEFDNYLLKIKTTKKSRLDGSEISVDGYAARIYGYPNDWYALAQDRSI